MLMLGTYILQLFTCNSKERYSERGKRDKQREAWRDKHSNAGHSGEAWQSGETRSNIWTQRCKARRRGKHFKAINKEGRGSTRKQRQTTTRPIIRVI